MGEEEKENNEFEEASKYACAIEINTQGETDNEEEEEEDNESEEEEEDNELDKDAYEIQTHHLFHYEALAERKRKALAITQNDGSAKKARQEDVPSASVQEIMEAMNYGGRRKSRKLKKRGRRKGSKNKLSPEISQMLGDATLHYAHGRYQEAISVLSEVVKRAPHLPETFHTLGLVHSALGNNEKAFNSYRIAALFMPKDSCLWKLLFTWSIERGDIDEARKCLSKAIAADPKEITLRFHQASLCVELGYYQRAAESYEQIQQLCPENVEALKTGAKLYLKCGQIERSISIVEDYLKAHQSEADLSVIDVLAAIFMEINAHNKALQHIEHAKMVCFSGNDLPLNLTIKAGICNIHLGDVEKAEVLFSVLQRESAYDLADLITEVADSYMCLEHFKCALKYYHLLEANPGVDNGYLHLKIAQCYLSLKERGQAITFFYKALRKVEDNIDARLTLASLLLEDAREDEAISVLSPPKILDPLDPDLDKSKTWWLDEKIKIKLCHIYRAKGMPEDFVNRIYPLVRETLQEFLQQKQEAHRKLPLPNLLKDEEDQCLIIDLSKTLASLQRYYEALEIINLTLRLANSRLPVEKKEELRSLGAQMAYMDPLLGFDCLKCIIQQHPYSLAAWNCYYKVYSRLGKSNSKHSKFLHTMRDKYKDCVPPIVISGHQFTLASHHQDAARAYLESYRLLPESPLINLCVGTSLVNLTLGFRLQNKNQCLAQGLAFLYNNLWLCENSQEALYNIARAYHHVGLVSLASSYYEKVLATCEKDYCIPNLPYENQDLVENWKTGYFDLRREAAYNLHLIYKKSGAFDLARQVLKDYCTF